MRNVLDEVLPFRLSQNRLLEVLELANKCLRSCVPDVLEVNEGFVELSDGTRYAIQTFYGEKVTDLKKLETAIADFAGRLMSRLDRDKPLYIRQEIEIHYHQPSHLGPNTFDYVSKPSQGYWIPYCRIRQPGHEINSISTSEIKRQIK